MYLDLVVRMYVHKFYVVFTHKEEALELLDYVLDLVVQMYGKKFYVLETFPFYIAICALNDDQVCYGVTT